MVKIQLFMKIFKIFHELFDFHIMVKTMLLVKFDLSLNSRTNHLAVAGQILSH